MPSAAPAYRGAARRTSGKTAVRVVRNTGRTPGISSRALAISRAIVAFVVVFALVGCIRVGLTAATVNTALATEVLTSQVSDLQSAGAGLEVQESSLANPANVRSIASTELGMTAPSSVDTIALGKDVVMCDEAGNLSLSLSLARLGQG